MAAIGIGCYYLFSNDDPGTTHSYSWVQLEEVELGPAISHDGVQVRQSYLNSPGGKILLETYPPVFEPMANVLAPLKGDYVREYFQVNSPWYAGFENRQVQASFNCATFAVGDFIGLGPTHVLDAVPRPGYGNPFQIVLDTYFDPVTSYSVSDENVVRKFENEIALNNNDVVCFVETRSPVLMYVHAGRILKRNGKNHVLSKIGRRGPVVLANIHAMLRMYDYTEIRIYRWSDDS